MSTKKLSRVAITLFAMIGLAFASKAQNLVPNPSFETANTCPSSNQFTAADWYNPNTASPDYFNPCGTNGTVPPNVLFGPQTARTGDSFAGAGWYGLGGGWYDYIQVKLTAPMVAGQTYNVSMWIVLADGAKRASDDIGIYISNDQFKSTANILPSVTAIIPTAPTGFGVFTTLTPQIKTADGNFVTDIDNWTQVSGTYIATGGEQAITIGCFEPWASTGTSIVNASGNDRCYYHIDDVSVELVVNVPAQPGPISGLQTVCDGSTQTFSVNAVSGATSYTWTLPNGWTGTSTTNSITATIGNTNGNVSVTANNISGSSVAQNLSVTVNTFPAQPGIITGPTTVCTGSEISYSVSTVQGADSYYWTLPSGWNGNSITTEIDVVAGISGGILTAYAQNECGTSGSQIGIVVQNPNVSITSNNGQLIAASGQDSYQWVNCENNYAEILGANQTIFTPAITGEYAVIVNKNGCVDTSTCIELIIENSGILENNLGISIFPNPVKQHINIVIENPSSEIMIYHLIDITGKIIISGNIKNSQSSISIPENVADGLYSLEITSGESLFKKKILIQK